jgi:hypothetical protein
MDESPTPSGWGVLHDRSLLNEDNDGPSLYLWGPVPTEAIARAINSTIVCPCITTVIPLFFPPGTTMMVSLPVLDDHVQGGPVH